MKRINLNARTVVSLALIAVVGLYLLMLVLPSIFQGFAPLWLLVIVAGLIPLIVLAWLIYMFFGKPRKITEKASNEDSRNWNRLLASIAIISGLGAVITSAISVRTFLFSTAHFAWENTSVAFLFISFAAVLLLSTVQNFVYWTLWNRRDKVNADERQKSVRQRVFELAYRINIFVLIVAACLWSSHSKLNQTLILVAGLSLIGMPAIIAGWRKDS